MSNSALTYNQDRLSRAMEEEGVDAVIASSPWNVSYLAGLYKDFSLLTFLVTGRDGQQGIVINEADAYFMRNDSHVDDVRDYPYSDTTWDAAVKSIDRVVEMLGEMNLTGARLGIEADFLPVRAYERLMEMLPDAVLVNGAPAMNEARIHKTPEEIDIIRKAAYYTDKAIYVGFAHARPGDTERSVANAMQAAMLRYGATTMSHDTCCSCGPQSLVVHAHPIDRPIQPGEVIHVDFGGKFSGYQTDLARNAVVGEPSSKQRDIYSKLYEIDQIIFENIKPGVVAKEIFALSEREFEKRGLKYPWGTLGHSTGLLVHEGFEITRSSDRVLEAGMTINIEPTHIEPGDARYHIEDTLLITETGIEIMSNYYDPREMYVIR